MSKLNPEQEEALKKIEEAEQKREQEEILQSSKIIQIVLDADVPQVSFNNVSMYEILGALDMVKELILSKKINNNILKQHLSALVQGIDT